MPGLRLMVVYAVSLLSIASATKARAEPITTDRLGLYVVSNNLDRAAVFYEAIFGKPQIRVAGMIGFDVAGGLYAIVDRKTFAASAVRGDTTRGYIKVRDIQAAYNNAAGAVPLSLLGDIKTEGRFRFFRIRDPDGNPIEFYAVNAN